MGLIQREVQKVYMRKEPYTDYSAMQGPCPDGFHIPTDTEWGYVYNVGINLGIWTSSMGSTMSQYLKLPRAGFRRTTDGEVSGQGSYGYYWSCTQHTSNVENAYDLYVSSSTIYAPTYTPKANAFSIRAFKDEVVNPIESGSTLKSGWSWILHSGGSKGIARNSTDGIISLSSDGTTWYTIADKNLGATTVWNSGDTLSQANCGNYYQWGNNYGFPRTGSVTTSSTKVDASNYGPGNYYSSSTFITVSSSPYDRSSVQNGNLWGGVTGPTTGGGDIQIRPEEWKPSSDVIAYFPLDSKYQLNSYDGSKVLNANNSSYSFSNNCIEFTNSCILNYQSTTTTNTYTVFGYMYGGSAGRYGMSSTTSLSASSFYGRWLYRNGDTDLSINKKNGSSSSSTGYTITAGWHCIVMVCSSSKEKVYVDGVLLGESSLGLSSTQPYLIINSVISGYKVGKIGLSNSEWTAEQVADFYNKTKSDFGL